MTPFPAAEINALLAECASALERANVALATKPRTCKRCRYSPVASAAESAVAHKAGLCLACCKDCLRK